MSGQSVVRGMVPLKMKSTTKPQHEISLSRNKREMKFRIRTFDIPQDKITLKVHASHVEYKASGMDKEYELTEYFPKKVRVVPTGYRLKWRKGWVEATLQLAKRGNTGFRVVPEESIAVEGTRPQAIKRKAGSRPSKSGKEPTRDTIAAIAARLAAADTERLKSAQLEIGEQAKVMAEKKIERDTRAARTKEKREAVHAAAEKVVRERLGLLENKRKK